MQISGCTEVVRELAAAWALWQASCGSVLAAGELPFSVLKLSLLIGWVYLCIYFVARVQFSPLVPRHRKGIVNAFTLFTGPIPLFIAAILSIARQVSSRQATLLEAVTDRLRNLRNSMKLSGLISFRDHYTIKLLDSSGRSIKEIYGHGKRSRHGTGILNLTEQIIFNALEERSSDILIDPKDETIY